MSKQLVTALAVLVVGVILVRKFAPVGTSTTTIGVTPPAPSRGAQEDVPPYAGQGAAVPDNPFLAFLSSVRAEEWALS